ncbi:Nuclease-related domain-containing protein [Desulfonispora thiosulfatigenes DSM 11270]|uniref:Nuclease-related domain-containing protein n=1 Tax=Desulfonispora thiosulfatigenes DSM 11270 TaxID=656914 RepID=A0A1W1V665_DESTI|nr:nuclease-related domain-containing protein [Desulfonispora thiosulfatigenes]SMB88858.1 Nuclease-related domain-containing protein [Desulfonispora thiosulfatigenes DSM 11270]
MGFIMFFPLLFFALLLLPKYFTYQKSSYKTETGNSFFKTLFDKGNYGEFLTFSYLEKLKGYHKIMANLYIPKEDGTTTEVDVLMITEKGIFVFESKNYSGWIFGDEKNKTWTQSLPNKSKNRFFNPIWQNAGHISAVKKTLDSCDKCLFRSYIIFSERCTLKKIAVNSQDIKVIKRNELLKTIKKDLEHLQHILSKEEVDNLYLKLKSYACVDDAVKSAHIENIENLHLERR